MSGLTDDWLPHNMIVQGDDEVKRLGQDFKRRIPMKTNEAVIKCVKTNIIKGSESNFLRRAMLHAKGDLQKRSKADARRY